MRIKEPYENLFGFVPELTEKRHQFSTEVMPEILEIHELFREKSMHSGELDEKTGQMILFALLASHMREGAQVHAISSRRLGATWKELHAVANLVFLFSGLSAMNFAIRILFDLKSKEEAGL
ncbi:carboxymuconolactone decarboxylase family protein [Paenibacillus sp. FSL M7-0420]|uniref:carboxymuconolactone decarboxylase family protein n=1 Tax=Paenibacillus sp. FSL M7-0420 TaxID=2921609 RepID=UPI0030F7D736